MLVSKDYLYNKKYEISVRVSFQSTTLEGNKTIIPKVALGTRKVII
jgi:hypothetical protein